MVRRRRPPRSGALTELPPIRILGQMAVLQTIYYFTALVLMFFNALVAGSHFSLDLVFNWASVRGDTTQGWMRGFVWVLDGGLVMPIAMVILISRSKLVLDFALSLHFFHLIVVSFYTGQTPRAAAWWLSMVIASALAVALGTWGCRYRELKPISFGGIGGGSAGGGGGHEEGGLRADGPSREADEEQGYARGGRKGRGRDGGGEYEMMGMNGAGDVR